MPWVLGIDEAGYGPNLGPLVQASVAMQLPDDDIAGWVTLRDRIRKVGEPEDDRILVDDSKKVYSGPNGFEKLERSIEVDDPRLPSIAPVDDVRRDPRAHAGAGRDPCAATVSRRLVPWARIADRVPGRRRGRRGIHHERTGNDHGLVDARRHRPLAA